MNTVPLKHLVRINDRSLPETTDPSTEFRYVDVGTVGRGKLLEEPAHLTFEHAPSRARRLVRSGDTIISTVRTYLRAVWSVETPTDDLVVSTGFAVLSPGPAVDARYLGWLIQSDVVVEEIVARSVGVSYPAINACDIGTVRVPVPPIATQCAIARYLDHKTSTIDALIHGKVRMIRLMGEKFAAMVSLATRAACVSIGEGNGLDPEWRRVALRRCLAASDYGVGQATQSTGPIAVLGMANVAGGEIVGAPSGYVAEAPPGLLVRRGDLLFNRTNSLALVGKVARVEDVGGPTTFASYLVRLRTNRLVSSSYLNYLLNTREVLELARSMALPSIGQANLNPNRYASMLIPLPSRQSQDDIVGDLRARHNEVRELSAKIGRQIALLREHRQALITYAMSGDFRIPRVAA